jgi:hypothetical protein
MVISTVLQGASKVDSGEINGGISDGIAAVLREDNVHKRFVLPLLEAAAPSQSNKQRAKVTTDNDPVEELERLGLKVYGVRRCSSWEVVSMQPRFSVQAGIGTGDAEGDVKPSDEVMDWSNLAGYDDIKEQVENNVLLPMQVMQCLYCWRPW